MGTNSPGSTKGGGPQLLVELEEEEDLINTSSPDGKRQQKEQRKARLALHVQWHGHAVRLHAAC